jgi:hypothetical protein
MREGRVSACPGVVAVKHSAPCRAVASLLAALLALAPALRASASGKPRPGVALVPYVALPGVPEATAAKVGELLAQELRSRDDLRILQVAAAPKSDSAAERTQADAAATQARAGLARATELAGKGKHAQAAEALQKAIAQLSARPLAVDDAGGPLLADAALQLAVERLVAGDEDGGDAALSLLVRLAPERSVAAADYPPAFLRELSGVRRRLLAAPRGSLRVLPPPGGGDSRVLLDGRVLRGAPLLIKDVLPGEHFVRVERGSQAFASKVVVVAGVETKVAAGASELGAQLVQGSIDRGAAASAARVAKAAGAQAALFGAVVKTPEGFSVRTFLAFAKGERIVALWPMVVDAELLGASVQVLRLADDTAAKLDGKSPDAALPIALGGSLEGTAPVPEVQGAPPPVPSDAEAALPIAPLVPETKPAAPAVSTAPAPAAPQAAVPAAASASPQPDDARRVAVPGAAVTAAAPSPAAEMSSPRAAAAEAPAPSPRPAAAEAPAPALRAAADPPSRRLVVPREPSADAADSPAPAPQAAAQPAPREATHRLEALEPEAIKTARETPPEKKNYTALWIITGVLVAGAAAAGGYFLYESGQSPSTATVNAGWSK